MTLVKDPRMTQELELLNEVYCDEMEIRPSQNSTKLKVKCYPLLEDKNIEHHYEYDNPFLVATIDVPNDYPQNIPKFYLESSHSKVAIGSNLSDLSERVERLAESLKGATSILDMLEYIRSWLYNDIAKKNKHFRKRHHRLSDEPNYHYDDEDEELEENLMKKTHYTEVTHERFSAWMTAFRAEMRSKQEKDPTYLRKKAVLSKPSGRMIFNDRSKEFSNFYDDEKNEEDDEVVDLKKEMKVEEEEGDEEEIEVDENVFDDEDDLEDNEEMVVDDR